MINHMNLIRVGENYKVVKGWGRVPTGTYAHIKKIKRLKHNVICKISVLLKGTDYNEFELEEHDFWLPLSKVYKYLNVGYISRATPIVGDKVCITQDTNATTISDNPINLFVSIGATCYVEEVITNVNNSYCVLMVMGHPDIIFQLPIWKISIVHPEAAFEHLVPASSD